MLIVFSVKFRRVIISGNRPRDLKSVRKELSENYFLSGERGEESSGGKEQVALPPLLIKENYSIFGQLIFCVFTSRDFGSASLCFSAFLS